MNLLSSGEMCVGDLVTCLQVPQPTASRHLAALKHAGLITSRRQGYWTYYALASSRHGLHAKLLDCLHECRNDKTLAADLKRAGRLRARGGCCPL
jgi:ArsR family transcriptional regulator, arsenate/arsenite/antimonite-responsive transcriptional repressor